MTYTASARGGYLLNSGYLSTSGSQIVDSSGLAVRIASIGWNNGDSTNFCVDGLYAASYTSILDSVKAAGFNCIRIAYCDVALAGSPSAGNISSTYNPSLVGKTFLQVLDAIMTYCGTIGLKIILDHHNNEGGSGGGGGQQGNGLWWDSGNGQTTDGSGNTGTVTQANFQANWVSLVTRYSSGFGTTLIGCDLTNEPTAYLNKCSWGDNAVGDIHAMFQTVGNAILAVNPNLLIICEGPQNYSGQFQTGGASGSNSGTPMPYGDISLAPTVPVTLNVANKVVYSIHIYPYSISGVGPTNGDSGATAIARYNAQFGFMYTGSFNAPVWIGEMGGSLDNVGPDSTGGSGSDTQAQEQAWASTLLTYMNGGSSGSGGPSFTSSQQPVPGSWWVLGPKSGQNPDGNQTAWGTGNYNTYQQTYTDLMLFTNPLSVSTGSTTQSVFNIAAGTSVTLKGTALFNEINSGTGATSITLPTMAVVRNANGTGHLYVIKDAIGVAATSAITVTASGGALIDGATSASISINYGNLTLIPNGTNWSIIGSTSASLPFTSIYPQLRSVAGRYYSLPTTYTDNTGNISSSGTQPISAVPIYVPGNLPVRNLACVITTASTAAINVRMGIYADASGQPGALIFDGGTVALAANFTGAKIVAITAQTLAAGWYWAALQCSYNASVAAFSSADTGSMNIETGIALTAGAAAVLSSGVSSNTGTFGALPTTFPAFGYNTYATPMVWFGY